MSFVYLYDPIVDRELDVHVDVDAVLEKPDPAVGYQGSIEICDVRILRPFWWRGKRYSGDLLDHQDELKPFLRESWLRDLEEEYLEYAMDPGRDVPEHEPEFEEEIRLGDAA